MSWIAFNYGVVYPSWLNETTTQIIIWAVLLPAIAFNVFLRYQMNKPGTPGPNTYGPPPGVGQALVF